MTYFNNLKLSTILRANLNYLKILLNLVQPIQSKLTSLTTESKIINSFKSIQIFMKRCVHNKFLCITLKLIKSK
jgi:hypothetical protein